MFTFCDTGINIQLSAKKKQKKKVRHKCDFSHLRKNRLCSETTKCRSFCAPASHAKRDITTAEFTHIWMTEVYCSGFQRLLETAFRKADLFETCRYKLYSLTINKQNSCPVFGITPYKFNR